MASSPLSCCTYLFLDVRMCVCVCRYRERKKQEQQELQDALDRLTAQLAIQKAMEV